MKKIRVSLTSYRIFKSILAMVLIVGLLFGDTTNSTEAYANEATESYDFAALSNTLANIMNVGVMPKTYSSATDGTDEGYFNTNVGCAGIQPLNGSNAGTGGIVVGMANEQTKLGDWIMSRVAGSSSTYPYVSLQYLPTDNDGSGTWYFSNSAYYYAVYGHLLTDIGFAKTGMNVSGTISPIRWASGGIMTFAYMVASVISAAFVGALKLLQAINPFYWLEAVAKDYSNEYDARYVVDEMALGELSDNVSIQYFIRMFAELYSSFANMSWGLIIPLMLALYFFNLFVLKKTRSTKRLLIRVVFLSIGVPLAGSLYTGFLNNMMDSFSSQITGVDQAILSTFVDFESWVKSSNLAIDDGMVLEASVDSTNVGGVATTNTLANLRNTCLAINKNAIDAGYNTTRVTEMTSVTFDNLTITDIDSESDIGGTYRDNAILSNYVMGLLGRYMNGDTYNSSAFAANIQQQISKNNYGLKSAHYATFLRTAVNMNSYDVFDTGSWDITDLLGDLTAWWQGSDKYDFQTMMTDNINGGGSWGKGANMDGSDEPKQFVSNATGDMNNPKTFAQKLGHTGYRWYNHATIFNNGSLGASATQNGSSYNFSSIKGDAYNLPSGTSDDSSEQPIVVTFKQQSLSGDSRQSTNGLSDMAMFNFLSSDFGSTRVTVYSGDGVASGLTQKEYYSVNLIGQGLMPIIYYVDTLVLLGCISIIGLLYAIAMLGAGIKMNLKSITNMPMAMMGSISYIAKFIGSVVGMIANILVTAFMYAIATNFLIGVASLIENTFLTQLLAAFSLAGVDVALIASSQFIAITTVVKILSIIGMIVITRFLLKIRKQAVSQITEWIQQVVGKFMEADAHPNPDKPKAGLGSTIVNSAMTGAGAIAGGALAGRAASQLMGGLAGGAGAKAAVDGDAAGSGDTSVNNNNSTSNPQTITDENGKLISNPLSQSTNQKLDSKNSAGGTSITSQQSHDENKDATIEGKESNTEKDVQSGENFDGKTLETDEQTVLANSDSVEAFDANTDTSEATVETTDISESSEQLDGDDKLATGDDKTGDVNQLHQQENAQLNSTDIHEDAGKPAQEAVESSLKTAEQADKSGTVEAANNVVQTAKTMTDPNMSAKENIAAAGKAAAQAATYAGTGGNVRAANAVGKGIDAAKTASPTAKGAQPHEQKSNNQTGDGHKALQARDNGKQQTPASPKSLATEKGTPTVAQKTLPTRQGNVTVTTAKTQNSVGGLTQMTDKQGVQHVGSAYGQRTETGVQAGASYANSQGDQSQATVQTNNGRLQGQVNFDVDAKKVATAAGATVGGMAVAGAMHHHQQKKQKEAQEEQASREKAKEFF